MMHIAPSLYVTSPMPAFQLHYTFSKPEPDMGVLQIKATSPINRNIFVATLAIVGTILSTVDWQSGKWQIAYVAIGVVVLNTLVFGLISYFGCKARSGELIIDGKNRKLLVREGLSMLSWKELKLPANGLVASDTYLHQDGRHVATYYRLWLFPQSADRELFAQLAQAVEKYKNKTVEAVPPLPAKAVRILQSKDDSLWRVLSESIAKTMNWDIFDFAALNNEYRHLVDLDKPFHQTARAVSQQPVPDEVPEGVRVKGTRSLLIRPYKIAYHITITVFMTAVLLAVMFAGMQTAKHIAPVVVMSLWIFLSFCIHNAFAELTFDEKGITITMKVLGVFNIGKRGFMDWNELEEVKVKKIPGFFATRLELVGDQQRIILTVSSEEAAHWIAQYLSSPALVSPLLQKV